MAEKSNVPYDTISTMSVSTQPMYTKCCLCFPLRLGCLILGYTNLTINVIQTMVFLGITTFVGLVSHGFDHIDHFDKSTSSSEDITTAEVENMQGSVLKTVGFMLLLVIIINAFWLIMNIACLVGLHKKRAGPIRVYIGFATARLTLGLAVFMYMVMYHKLKANAIIAFAFDLGLTAYFIFVYYMYTVELKREEQAGAVKSAPTSDVYIYPTKLEKGHLVA